jgi:thymidylate synthase ThyX
LDLDGEELWDTLCCEDRTVASRDRIWKTLEDEYFYELSTDEGENLKPEEARGILPNDTKTELIMTGFLEDFYYTPPANSSEKAGFFYLRCAPDAQADIRVLAESLKEQMYNKGIDRWK